MNDVEFWTEVVSMIQWHRDMLDKDVEGLNMEDDEDIDMLFNANKDTLDRMFERANNELIIASQNSTTYNTREELLTILKSYQTMIDKDGFKYPAVVINDIKASIKYVLEKNNSKGGLSHEQIN